MFGRSGRLILDSFRVLLKNAEAGFESPERSSMRLTCMHCRRGFTITAKQLGRRGWCPHCGAAIQLPDADDPNSQEEDVLPEPTSWWKNSVSALGSVIFHTLLILVLTWFQCAGPAGNGPGEEVLIGELPDVQLGTGSGAEELESPEQPSQVQTDQLEELQVEPAQSAESSLDEELVVRPSASGGASSSFSVGATGGGSGGGGAGGGGGGWDKMLQGLRRHGLDIVIAFDSTGSMGGEINEVKRQIRRIGGALIKLVPKARISICTYRDDGDDFVVRGSELTGEIAEVEAYLSQISAEGGGDEPEAVRDGLQWSIRNNQFRPHARKVILLFGDAPPHREQLQECLELAAQFRGQQGGVVSTVTCRAPKPLTEFQQIARAGGGEAFLTGSEREIMTQLVVLVFGSRHRGKVIEAFRMLGDE